MTPQTPLTARELQAWLRARFPKEDERHEWKEWRSLKQNISGRKGEDLASYISALANMDGGCVVIGVQDRSLAVTGIQDFADYTVENVVHRVLGKTPGLPSMGLRVEELRASDTGAVVWLVHVPRHAPRELVLAHDRAWQRDGDSLVELREDRRRAILTELIAGQDWSAQIVAGASLADLDPAAIAKARSKYTEKHQNERWAAEMAHWSVEQFLAKAKMTTMASSIARPCCCWAGPNLWIGCRPSRQKYSGRCPQNALRYLLARRLCSRRLKWASVYAIPTSSSFLKASCWRWSCRATTPRWC